MRKQDETDPKQNANIFRLVEDSLPEGLEECFTAFGFSVHFAAGKTLENIPEPGSALHVAWINDDWVRGLRFLRNASRPERRTALLVGAGMPPLPVEQQARALGTLGCVQWPLKKGLLSALGRALDRSGREASFQALDELRTLASPEDNAPFLLFQQIARIADTLLENDLTLIAVQDPVAGSLLLLDVGESGLQPVEWPTTDPTLPHDELPRKAMEEDSLLIVPDLREHTMATSISSYRSAIILPIKIGGQELKQEISQPSTVVSLYWEEPFLPTAVEYLFLEALAALGRAGLLYSANHRRLSTAHVATSTALDWLHQATALPNLEKSWDALRNQVQSEFTYKLLSSYAASPYLDDLWVRISSHSRDEPSWVSLYTSDTERGPPVQVPDAFLEGQATKPESSCFGKQWALFLPVRDERRRFGALVGIFRNRTGTLLARDEMHRLAKDLAFGIRFFRRAANNAAVIELTKILSNADPPAQTLLEMARVVKREMAADGCKITAVLRTPDGLGLRQICRTDTEPQNSEKNPVPIDEERGLADWVLLKGKWLLIDRPSRSDRIGMDPEIGLTEDHQRVKRLARSEKEFDITTEQADSEGAILMFPLYRQGGRVGVLTVWRLTSDDFDAGLDTESLQHFSPYIASAGGQALQVKTLQEQFNAVSLLASDLAKFESLPKCYDAVIRHIGKLACVPHAILLLSNGSGHFFTSAVWNAPGHRLPEAFRHFQLQCRETQTEWNLEIELTLTEKLRQHNLGEFRCHLIVELFGEESQRQTSFVVLLDRANPYPEIGIFTQDFLEQGIQSFLRYAGAMLEKHMPDFKHKVIDDFFTNMETVSDRPRQILERAAQLVLEVTGANGALAYGGDYKSRKVTASVPKRHALEGLEVLPGSFTQNAIAEEGIKYFIDITAKDPPAKYRRSLAKISKAFGWKALRSWLACPVFHERRYFGLIEIFTSDTGVYLGPDHVELVEAIAHRAAWEIHKFNRREILSDLNDMAKELADTEGVDLGQEIVQRLGTFSDRYVREGCGIAIASRTEMDDVLIQNASQSLGNKVVERLSGLSKAWNELLVPWKAHERLPHIGKPANGPMKLSGVAVPLQLSGQTLGGHLFFFDSRPFSDDEISVIQEAARETALVLNGERLREAWRTSIGMFRHALLGPVQGLMSSAKALADQVLEAGLDPESIRETRAILEAEAESIRLWRENQRFYMKKEPEIVTRKESLVELLQTCIERFCIAMTERRISLKEDFPEKGSLIFPFDRAALDLAVSNLLDNARKYSFSNQIVTLGTKVAGDQIQIWVEDVGHQVPEHLDDQIYDFGRRLDFRDPVRVIHGEGLGLPMAQAIIGAHGGEIYHSCKSEGYAEREQHQRYRVRFTVEIPHHWRK